MPNKRGAWKGGPGEILKIQFARLEKSPKFNRLFSFLSKIFSFSYKTSMCLESLCWMEFLPKFNMVNLGWNKNVLDGKIFKN